MVSNSDSSKNSKGRRFRSTASQLVVRWRYRGHTGRLIRRHRALRSLDVQSSSIAHPIVLTTATLIGLVLARNLITNAWGELLRFWGTNSGIDLAVTMRHVAVIGEFTYEIPSLRLFSRLPLSEELNLSFSLCADLCSCGPS